MPQRGEILLYKDYAFEDASKRDKLFVVLNIADINTPCLVLKTTSQSARYLGAKKGCNPSRRVFLVPAEWGGCFELDTYIQLPQIIEIPTVELLQGSLSKKIRIVNSLPPDCFAQLKNCLKQFKRDISPQHWRLIFRS